jgi:methylmalonyl-CoA mutase N-terminal domain/subunit
VAFETGVTKTIDPLGGSFYIECLTDEIEKRIWDYLALIEKKGGMLEGITSGWIQNEIATAAYEHQKAIESGERVVVGVNKFISDREPDALPYLPDQEDQKITIQALKKLRRERDTNAVKKALKKFRSVALTDENIIPATVEAVRNYATIGEICEILKEIFGEFEMHI